MKNLYILTVLMTVFSINLFAQQPPVSEFTVKAPKGTDLPMDTLLEYNQDVIVYDEEPDPTEGYRMLYWLHGLNGDATSLANPATATIGMNSVPIMDFPPRKVYNNEFISYNPNQQSLGTAAAHAEGQMDIDGELDENYDERDGFVISHSQGGIVARWIDRYYSMPVNHHKRKFGGIITFATSNQGAQIINNQHMVPGIVVSFATSMTAGPIAEQIESIPLVLKPIIGNSIYEIYAELLVFFSENVSEYLMGINYPTITNEFQVGASQIDDLNNYIPDGTFIVPFYSIREILTFKDDVSYSIPIPEIVNFPNGYNLSGVLQAWGLNIQGNQILVNLNQMPVPISWATIEYFLNSASDETYFGAHLREHNTALNAHKTQFKYHTKRMAYTATAAEYLARRNTAQGLVQYIHNNIRYNDHIEVRDAYQEGVDFMNQFDDKYRVYIGARVSEQVGTDSDKCVCEVWYSTYTEPTIYHQDLAEVAFCGEGIIDDQSVSSYNCEEVSGQPIIQWINKPSDGVVLAESAMNIPQATFSPDPILGSTHMGLRNDNNLKDALNLIFEGEVGDFFKTAEQ